MASLPNERVLIIDDSNSSTDPLRALLASLPVEVIVSNGEGAKQQLQRGRFAAVVLDAEATEVNIADIVRAVHSVRPGFPTPVIVLASSPERSDDYAGNSAASVELIAKPPKLDSLRDKLVVHLALCRMATELDRASAELVIALRASEMRAAFAEKLLEVHAGSQSLEAVLETALPPLGDAAFLVLVERSGLEKWQAGGMLADSPSIDLHDWRFEVIASDVMRTGKALVIPNTTMEPDPSWSAESHQAILLLREMGIRGCIGFPLAAEQLILGAIVFVKSGNSGEYSTPDVELVGDLARVMAKFQQTARTKNTESARYRVATEPSERTQDAFLSSFSHEIRAPLNAIVGWANILASGEVDGGKRAHALETIERNARALATLVTDVLDPYRSPWRAGTTVASRVAGFPELLSGLHALVVEDDPDSSELVETILRRFGADVTCVSTVRAALGALAERRPDVLVSDIGLPDDDGLALIRRIREMQELAGLPAIALSAYASRRDITQALAAGFQAYIAKPIEPNQLGKIIADVVNG